MSGVWGERIYVNTLKHLFQKHFIYKGDDCWNFNPHDKDKVTDRIIPTLRMVMSWNNKKTLKLTDRDLVETFLGIIQKDYPELYKAKQTSKGV